MLVAVEAQQDLMEEYKVQAVLEVVVMVPTMMRHFNLQPVP
jgi:hypothetical protein